MPQYRKLHTKIVESFDVAEMPDDFTRLMWVFLPLKSCAEGRGIDHPSWLKAQLFPLRDDVSGGQISAAMEWFSSRRMVQRYQVGGRPFYQITNWEKYQGNTTKEANSPYPAPETTQNQRETNSKPPGTSDSGNSRVTPELLQSCSNTDADSDADSDADADSDFSPPPPLPQGVLDFLESWKSHDPHRRSVQLTDKRKAKITRALKDPEFLANYTAALERGKKSGFLSGWSGYTIDWFLSQKAGVENWRKVLEGNYDDKKQANSNKMTSRPIPAPDNERVGGLY